MFSLWLGSRASLSPSPRQLLPSAKWHCSATLVSLKWLGGLRGGAPLIRERWGSSVHAGGLRSCPWAPPRAPAGGSAARETQCGGRQGARAAALAPPAVLTVTRPLRPVCPCLSPPLANKLLWELMLLASLIRKYLRPCFAYDNTQNGWQFKNIKAELWKVRPGPQGFWKAGLLCLTGSPCSGKSHLGKDASCKEEVRRWERGLWGVKRRAGLGPNPGSGTDNPRALEKHF